MSETITRNGRTAILADPAAYAAPNGRIGGNDPAELVKLLTDGELHNIATRMPNTVEGRVSLAEIGRRAYENGEHGAPALNRTVLAAIDRMPVGTGGAEIMAAFSRGYDAARDAAADAVLAEPAAPTAIPQDVSALLAETGATDSEARAALAYLRTLPAATLAPYAAPENGPAALFTMALLHVRAGRDALRSERAAKVARTRMLAARYPGRTHLISAGSAVAIPAGDVKAGDTLVYNYGSTAVVLRVEAKGTASVVIVTSEGPYGSRTCRRSTLVAISDRPDANL